MANVKISTINTTQGYQQPVNPNADGVVANGFYPQNSTSNDANAGIERATGGELNLKAGGTATLAVHPTSVSAALVRIANSSSAAASLQIDAPTNDVQGIVINGATGAVSSAFVISGDTLAGTPAANIRNFNNGPAARVYAEGSDPALVVITTGTGDAINATGTVQATTFSGSGALLTSIPNSATTATNANTASAIVARDASGNFSAGTITASLNGNASTATSATSATNATNAANITLADVTTAASYRVPFGLTANNVSALRTATSFLFNPNTGTLAATTFSGSGASLTSIPNSATTATSANTASAIVARDGSGNFSAGTITASLSGNATSATSATSATTATNATNVATTDETASASTFYPAILGATSGNNGARVSSTKLTFVPSTGRLTATSFGGSGAGLTSIPNSATTATNANTASAIVARDANGAFSAGIVTATGAAVTGGSATADNLTVDANSSGSAVRITQLGSGNAILVEDSTNPDASPFAVTATGTVGVGTTSILGNTKMRIEGGDLQIGASNGLAGNLYFDTAWKYAGNGFGNSINYSSGSILLQTAPSNSGGAAAAATVTTRVTVANAGNVTISSPDSGIALSVAGQIDSTATGYKFPDATTQTTSAGTISRLTSAVTTTSTAFTDITGLTASLATATAYFFEAYLIWQQNNTAGGIGFAINGPGNMGVLDYTIQYQNFANDAAGTIQTVHSGTYDSAYTIPTTTTAANTNYIARISGVLVTTITAGTLALRFKSSNASYTASIRPGSWLLLRRGNT